MIVVTGSFFTPRLMAFFLFLRDAINKWILPSITTTPENKIYPANASRLPLIGFVPQIFDSMKSPCSINSIPTYAITPADNKIMALFLQPAFFHVLLFGT